MFEYEFKLTKSQSSSIIAARDEMRRQNLKENQGILFLQVSDSLKNAIGYFVPNETACKVNEILSDWLIMEREKMEKEKKGVIK